MAGLDVAAAIAALSAAGTAVTQHNVARQQQAFAAREHQRQLQELERNRRVEERDRRDQLRTAQGAARARFGAAGVTSTGGSAAAVLRGLAKRSEREIGDLRRADALRRASLDDGYAHSRRVNLLEARNQLFQDSLGLARAGYELFGKRS